MKCPHLKKDVIYFCESGPHEELPGTARLRKHCKAANYRSCPIYIASASPFGYYYELESAA